jgi:SAM-dependent methyltransferase
MSKDLDIRKQIITGKLVCPKTKKNLFISKDEQWLFTYDKSEKYQFYNKQIPIMLIDPETSFQYIEDSENIKKEYTISMLKKRESVFGKLKAKLTRDYRTKSSINAFYTIFEGLSEDSICLAIGGGPGRSHHLLTNINIGIFPNVDVVGDAHFLPYADNSVDAISCEAVIEHLYNPIQAIKEIYRVLKPNKKAFICTPFLQPYHGYPYHYQNYTLTGHKHIFESNGFTIIDAGTCVGPVYTFVSFISIFINEYFPILIRRPAKIAWEILAIIIRPFDLILNRNINSHVLASTTYVLVQK